jgi:NhaC family Na+:H+ antiporter
MATTLTVATFTYAPCAFFNLLNPFVAAIYGFAGFTIEKGDVETGSITDLAYFRRLTPVRPVP